MNGFGTRIIKRLPEAEQTDLKAVQIPSANAVREKNLSSFKKRKQKI